MIIPALLLSPFWRPLPPFPSGSPGPAISQITSNLSQYQGGKVPAYSKLEITFQVDTLAQNLQLPYDPAPPSGVRPGMGISVDALFTPDEWKTVYRQPAFYYQAFQEALKDGREWIYPTGDFSWKVRFAPPTPGRWQYRLVAQDLSGRSHSPDFSFQVVPSDHPGFVRVSPFDPRYFQFENGRYFPGLGYNMNYDNLSWKNPVLDNQENFERMQANGVQLVRFWLSQWGIYGPSWNPWNSPDPERHSNYVPDAGLSFEKVAAGSDVSMKLTPQYNPCMMLGFMKPAPAVKAQTTYRVRIRYYSLGLQPQDTARPFGLVAKTGGWLWGGDQSCSASGTGQPLTPYIHADSTGWKTFSGVLHTGDEHFLPNFYLALENVASGQAFIDYVWVEEDLGDGRFGPNILPKPWMSHDLYMEQRSSFAFDRVVALAEAHQVYLRPVVMEKLDWIFNRIDFAGQPVLDSSACKDENRSNDPPRCPDTGWFYGNGREMTRVRWLQHAWWRYLQARWGYSTSIHSWELLNEGDPASTAHFTLADEFGRYMRQFAPNHHLVSTSFWHSFPSEVFWRNPAYQHVDFADLHQYAREGTPGFADPALWTYSASMEYGALQEKGAGKPVIRGETGFISREGAPSSLIVADQQGLWLHNLLWAGLNPGGLIESYWFDDHHIYQEKDGEWVFDQRMHFRPYSNFIQDLPLNLGLYQDAQAVVSTPALRAWGQFSPSTGCAHLWIQNTRHTWQNGIAERVTPVSGEISLNNLPAGQNYRLEWWDTYQPDPARQILSVENVQAGSDGLLTLPIQNLAQDVAVKLVALDGAGEPACIPDSYNLLSARSEVSPPETDRP